MPQRGFSSRSLPETVCQVLNSSKETNRSWFERFFAYIQANSPPICLNISCVVNALARWLGVSPFRLLM